MFRGYGDERIEPESRNRHGYDYFEGHKINIHPTIDISIQNEDISTP